MDRQANYLRVSALYSVWLGGIRWSNTGDAVEYIDGSTFVFAPQIARFLQGFKSAGSAPHFEHVLHMLHLLGNGRTARPQWATRWAEEFAANGRPLGNAGAWCAAICRNIPHTSRGFDLNEVTALLYSGPLEVLSLASWKPPGHVNRPGPALSPEEFEKAFAAELEKVAIEEWPHWFQHGCSPVRDVAEELTEELPPLPPRTISERLDSIAQRERLAGAIPFVRQLVSALALPPRQLAQPELPIGGYADVTSRGQPEHLLPSQFAIDSLEFVRRFAENELLFFRREEPTSQFEEELVLLVDQGVRTWGRVRLVLAAAVMALAKLAEKGRKRLLLAATSSAGETTMPADAKDEDIAHLLEASDLSLSPAAALRRVLAATRAGARDVVLLTHPRSLAENAVRTTTQHLDKNTRLFALSIDDEGQALLAQIRYGTPVVVRRFQIAMGAADSEPRATAQQAAQPALGNKQWTGDVEPIGFPFRFGITSHITHLAFDHAGELLLTVSRNGVLHVWSHDATRTEILSRGMFENAVFTNVTGALGVMHGFVITAQVGEYVRAIFYDFPYRQAKLLPIEACPGKGVKLHYLPERDCILMSDSKNYHSYVDLAIGEHHSWKGWPRQKSSRVCDAWFQVQHDIFYSRPQILTASVDGPGTLDGGFRILNHDSNTGTLWFGDGQSRLTTFQPQSDGKSILKGCKLLDAQFCGMTLAARFGDGGSKTTSCLRLFRLPEGTPIYEHLFANGKLRYALSPDGLKLALQRSACQVTVQSVSNPVPTLVTLKGQSHSGLKLHYGTCEFVIDVGNRWHNIRWPDRKLEHRIVTSVEVELNRRGYNKVTRWSWTPHATLHDLDFRPQRFRFFDLGTATIAADEFGHLLVFDHSSRLVCMFFFFRDHFGAWMPDGTRCGSPSITGGVATENAPQRIGQALWNIMPGGSSE